MSLLFLSLLLVRQILCLASMMIASPLVHLYGGPLVSFEITPFDFEYEFKIEYEVQFEVELEFKSELEIEFETEIEFHLKVAVKIAF